MALATISHIQGRTPVTIFQLQERIHLGNFSELEKLAKEAYENGTRNLVIDLSRTDSLTSIGLRALIIVHKVLAKDSNGNHLKIAGATAVIREILQVTGVSQFIEVYDTVDEAVAAF
ncbi:MAG: STAS domain-containing protein [Chloroflexota bacterium]|jgi:anti-sigma B factor antagonist